MPPLIVFIMGLVAMILFMTVSVWLAVVIVVVLVFTCLLRIRHLGRSRPPRDGTPQVDSFWSFFWLNSSNPDGVNAPPPEPEHSHQGHHHHHDGSVPDVSSGTHHGGFDGGGGGHHGGGGDFGGGGGHH